MTGSIDKILRRLGRLLALGAVTALIGATPVLAQTAWGVSAPAALTAPARWAR